MRFDLTAEDSISAHGIWDSIRKFSIEVARFGNQIPG